MVCYLVVSSRQRAGQIWQVVLPKVLREEFLTLAHGSMTGGHLGQKKAAAAVQARAYWPTWSSDLSLFMRRCQQCARYHRGTLPCLPQLQTPTAGEPWQKVSIDITGPHPKSAKQNQYILRVIDHFSKWAEARAHGCVRSHGSRVFRLRCTVLVIERPWTRV